MRWVGGIVVVNGYETKGWAPHGSVPLIAADLVVTKIRSRTRTRACEGMRFCRSGNGIVG